MGRENGDSAEGGTKSVASSKKASFDPMEQEQSHKSQVLSGGRQKNAKTLPIGWAGAGMDSRAAVGIAYQRPGAKSFLRVG